MEIFTKIEFREYQFLLSKPDSTRPSKYPSKSHPFVRRYLDAKLWSQISFLEDKRDTSMEFQYLIKKMTENIHRAFRVFNFQIFIARTG